jgi:hypothetical protein
MSDDKDNKNEQRVRIFHVETRFQKMAKRNGAVPRERVMQSAVANIEEIKPGFDDWVKEEVEKLAKTINTAKSGAPTSEWLDEANGHCRQLRDVGTTMGFELLTYIAGSLCDVLDAVEAGMEVNVESITTHMDALHLSRQEPYRHMKSDEVPELTNGLRQLTKTIAPPPA